MASPSFRSASNNTGTSTGATATEPTGAASGDGMLLLVLVELAHSAFVPPTGWTPVPNCNALDLGTSATAYAYYIRRGGSAPDLAFSWSGGSKYFEWSCYAFSGVIASGSIIDASNATASSSGTQPDPPSISTLTSDTLVCAVAFHWTGWAGGASAPATYSLRFGAAGYDHALATKAQAATGSVDPGTFSAAGGSDVMRAMTIAIASPAVAPVVSVLSPADNETGVSLTPTIAVTFDQNIQAGTGSFNLYTTIGDTLVESFDVSTDVSIGSATASFTPAAPLSLGVEYYVLADSGVVQATDDSAPWGGIASTTTWSFTATAGYTPPITSVTVAVMARF